MLYFDNFSEIKIIFLQIWVAIEQNCWLLDLLNERKTLSEAFECSNWCVLTYVIGANLKMPLVSSIIDPKTKKKLSD